MVNHENNKFNHVKDEYCLKLVFFSWKLFYGSTTKTTNLTRGKTSIVLKTLVTLENFFLCDKSWKQQIYPRGKTSTVLKTLSFSYENFFSP